MRLLNVETLSLEEFWDRAAPPYAILSHTWDKQEVSFQAISDLGTASQLAGFAKIQGCCRQASIDGYKWVWIDTCCIDKCSSAELSEAINSMFRWYRKSKICYAYLSDVPSDDNPPAPGSAFSKSRWFTRGWTLQELIAPLELEFFSKDWTKLECRRNLALQISKITRIDSEVFTGFDPQPTEGLFIGLEIGLAMPTNHEPLQNISIAQRMSWASRRSTTRVEDMAYCLMGIFDINMPLLYGEGKKAFIRLQEEIIKRSIDHTLFAWKVKKPVGSARHKLSGRALLGGFLASSPSDFENSDHYIKKDSMHERGWRVRPYSITNMGLCIDLPIFPMPGGRKDEWIAVLNCTSTKSTIFRNQLGIPVLIGKESEFGTVHSEHYYATPCQAIRFVEQEPITFRVIDHGQSGSKQWLSLQWGPENTEIQAWLGTLYFPQVRRAREP